MYCITPHLLREGTNTKSTNNIQKLVLAAVNGMPDHIEKEMTKIMKDLSGMEQQRTNEARLHS